MHSVREKCVAHKSSRCMLMLAALVTLGYSTVISSQGPIIQMSSLMHHISTPRTGTQIICSKMPVHSCRCQFRMGCNSHIYMLGNNGHTRCAYTPTWLEVFYITIASMWLHVCQYIALICMYVHALYIWYSK